MREELKSKGYRQAFVEENVKTGIAFQVRALREHRSWMQKELGDRLNKPQNVISRIEDPDYGRFTIRTLLDLAAAFDVALLIKFVSFGELLNQLRDLSPEKLAVQSFDEELESARQCSQPIHNLVEPRFENDAHKEHLFLPGRFQRGGAISAAQQPMNTQPAFRASAESAFYQRAH